MTRRDHTSLKATLKGLLRLFVITWLLAAVATLIVCYKDARGFGHDWDAVLQEAVFFFSSWAAAGITIASLLFFPLIKKLGVAPRHLLLAWMAGLGVAVVAVSTACSVFINGTW